MITAVIIFNLPLNDNTIIHFLLGTVNCFRILLDASSKLFFILLSSFCWVLHLAL